MPLDRGNNKNPRSKNTIKPALIPIKYMAADQTFKKGGSKVIDGTNYVVMND